MSRLYITADQIGTPSGGGAVTRNELEALQNLDEKVIAISAQDIAPGLFGLPFSPFLEDYLACQKVAELLKSNTITHAHFYSGCFSITVQLLKRHGVKVSYTCPAHDRKVSMEEHARLGLEYPYPHLKDERLWKFFFEGVLKADVVIAPSKLAADFIESQGARRVEIIPHGCVLPERGAPLPRVFCPGFFSQPGPDKGLVYLLRAWSQLNYSQEVLKIAGLGTETLGPLIRSNFNGGKYQLQGFVSNPSDFYSSISVLVAPSVCESFGITILEALAHGRPVIVSDGAGAKDMVTEGEDGFVVPKRNPDAIAERIDFLKKNPQRVIEMGKKARKKAEQYTWGKVKEKYVNLWRSCSI